MQQDPSPYEQPSHPRADRRVSRLALGAGAAVILAMAGAGVAFAVSGPSKSTPAAAPPTTSKSSSTLPAPRPFMRGPRAFFGPGPGPAMGRAAGGGPVVHANYTIKTPSGYEQVLEQTGTVTDVSSTSITVLSTDKFSQTYAVVSSTVVDAQANGINTIQPNDQVSVQGVVQNGQDTATNIVDTTRIGNSRKGFFPNLVHPPTPSQSTPPQPAHPQSNAGTAAF